MSEPVFEKRTEAPSGKIEGKALEKAPNADVQKCLDYLSGSFACSAEEKAQAELFLNAHAGQAKEFAKVVTHCESTRKVDWLGDNISLPLKSTSIAELCQKPELAQLKKTEVAEKKTEVAEKKTEVADADTAETLAKIEKQKTLGNEMLSRLDAHPELKSKYLKQFEGLRDGTLKADSPEAKAFAKEFLSDLKKSFEDAKANGGDTSKAVEDLKFFAEKFRDLGVINHAEFRKIFEEPATKSHENPNKSTGDGRTALAGNFNSTGDGRTFFALDRTGSDGRKFDEFVRVSPDGKTANKEIVGKYGYSLTLDVPLETGKVAAKEGELASAEGEKGRVENQAKYVEETFGPNGSKIPSSEDPKFKEYKEAVDKIAKDKGIQIDEQDPKKTLAAVKDSIKTSYVQTLEKTSKTQSELKELQKESGESSAKDGKKNEKNVRDAIDFLDRTGIAALGPKATEELLKKFGAAGCENGKPVNLEKFLKDKNALAAEFRAFVTNALGQEESSLFKLEEVPPSLKALFDQSGRPLELKSVFLAKGLVTDDGRLNLEKASAPKPETQTA